MHRLSRVVTRANDMVRVTFEPIVEIALLDQTDQARESRRTVTEPLEQPGSSSPRARHRRDRDVGADAWPDAPCNRSWLHRRGRGSTTGDGPAVRSPRSESARRPKRQGAATRLMGRRRPGSTTSVRRNAAGSRFLAPDRWRDARRGPRCARRGSPPGDTAHPMPAPRSSTARPVRCSAVRTPTPW